MLKFIFLILILSVSTCDKSSFDGQFPTCIQRKLDGFIEKENSRSVQWRHFDGEDIFKFSSTSEDVYLNDRCETLCQYAYISSFLPNCKIELENTTNWKTIWEK